MAGARPKANQVGQTRSKHHSYSKQLIKLFNFYSGNNLCKFATLDEIYVQHLMKYMPTTVKLVKKGTGADTFLYWPKFEVA